MKPNYLVLSAALLASTASFGSSLVCSGEQLYSSDVRADFGTQPLPGTPTGTVVILYDGKVLLNHTSVSGLHVHGAPPYRVELVGEAKVLEQNGNSIQGSSVFKQTAVLIKVDSLNPSQQEEVARQLVVCRQTWAMVP